MNPDHDELFEAFLMLITLVFILVLIAAIGKGCL